MIYVYIIVCLFALLLMIILFGAGKIRALQVRNRSLLKEISTMSNTFREKGIEKDGLLKEIKILEGTIEDLKKENKNLRRNK